MPIPAREDKPRDPHPNFYWLQEDYLTELAAARGFGFTILRPPMVLGAAYGAAMNVVPVIGVYGGHVRARAAGVGGRGTRDFVGEDKPRLMREVMGLGNCTQTMAEMSQAVPPAFTEFVGRELIAHLAWRSPPPASPETDEG